MCYSRQEHKLRFTAAKIAKLMAEGETYNSQNCGSGDCTKLNPNT